MKKICKNCKFAIIDAIGYKWCKKRESVPPQEYSYDGKDCKLFEG